MNVSGRSSTRIRSMKVDVSLLFFSFLEIRSWIFFIGRVSVLSRLHLVPILCSWHFWKLDHEWLLHTESFYWNDDIRAHSLAFLMSWTSSMNVSSMHSPSIETMKLEITSLLFSFLDNQRWMSFCKSGTCIEPRTLEITFLLSWFDKNKSWMSFSDLISVSSRWH